MMACPDRLRTSSVLVVGASGLGAELCKNIVLAGVKSVTLLDHALLTPVNLASRFLGHADGVNVRPEGFNLYQQLSSSQAICIAEGNGLPSAIRSGDEASGV